MIIECFMGVLIVAAAICIIITFLFWPIILVVSLGLPWWAAATQIMWFFMMPNAKDNKIIKDSLDKLDEKA